AYPVAERGPLFVAFGAVAGLAGHLYNGTSLRPLAVMDRLDRWPIEVRAAAIGELVGALGFFVPTLIGGGDEIPQRTLAGGAVLAVLPLAFVLRFGLGAVSYAAPVPGGLFAPDPGAGGTARIVFRRILQAGHPGCGPRSDGFRRGRHGGVLHGSRAGSGYRHRAGHRDDPRLTMLLPTTRPVLRQCWC